MRKLAIVMLAILAFAEPASAATTSAPSFKLTVPLNVSNIAKPYIYAGVQCRLSPAENPAVGSLPQIFSAASGNELAPVVVPIAGGTASFTFGLPASPTIHSAVCRLLGFASAPNERPKPLSDFSLTNVTEYVSVGVPATAPAPTPSAQYDLRQTQKS